MSGKSQTRKRFTVLSMPAREIAISYRSDTPMITNAGGERVISCQVSDSAVRVAARSGIEPG